MGGILLFFKRVMTQTVNDLRLNKRGLGRAGVWPNKSGRRHHDQ